MTELIICRVLRQIPETSKKLSIVRQKNQLASCGDTVTSSGYMYIIFQPHFRLCVREIGWHQASREALYQVPMSLAKSHQITRRVLIFFDASADSKGGSDIQHANSSI